MTITLAERKQGEDLVELRTLQAVSVTAASAQSQNRSQRQVRRLVRQGVALCALVAINLPDQPRLPDLHLLTEKPSDDP